jgi:hypothetical protein
MRRLSLLELARRKKLPERQYMDYETLEWIKKNNPFAGIQEEVNFSKLDFPKLVEIINKYTPDKKWFIFPQKSETIHGLRHVLRVCVYSVVLHDILLKGDPIPKIKNLCIASVLHDLKRISDKSDSEHGKRAADWFMEKYEEIAEKFNIHLSRRDCEEIYYGVYCHETPYEELLNKKDYYRYYGLYQYAIDVIKASDALDRYRLPKLKWWINDNFLKLHPSLEIKMFAYKLVIYSEESYLRRKSSKDSILEAIERIQSEN